MKSKKLNKKNNKGADSEDSNKSLLTKYARKSDKADADQEDGKPIKIKKEGKKYGVVALKHKQVIRNLEKNLGKSGKKASMKQAMIDAGYTPSYASNGDIIKTKNWNKTMDEYLPDDMLGQVHKGLVLSQKLDYMLFNPDIKDDDIYELIDSVGCVLKKIIHGIAGTHAYYFAPDNMSRNKAVELAYKIKGKMAPDILEIRKGLEAMTDTELAEIIKKQTHKFTKAD